MHISHDHGAHSSDDPRYTDTWYWSGVDPQSGCVVWAHLSWLPAKGRGQHVVATISPDGVRRERAETTEPLTSSLLSVEIVEPWQSARLTSTSMSIDIQWKAFHDAVNFGELWQVDDAMKLRHFQSGGRAKGSVAGLPFSGSGIRSRSFGPRNQRRFVKHWAIGMVALDRDAMLNVNALWAETLPSAAPPGTVFAAFSDGGKQAVYTQDIVCMRRRDGAPAELRLPNGTVVALDISQSLGETRFILDPNSAPSSDFSDEPAYAIRDIYVTASSPTLGRLVGWYEEGTLWVN